MKGPDLITPVSKSDQLFYKLRKPMTTKLHNPMRDVFTINKVETMKVLVSSLRAKVLLVLVNKTHTVKEISKILQVPPNRLYYHVNLLEQHGLIQVIETRMVSGILESHYRAVAAHYLVDPALLAPGSPLSGQTLEIILKNTLDVARDEIIRLTHQGVINIAQTPPDPQALLARRTTLVVPNEVAEQVYQKIDDFLLELGRSFSVELENKATFSSYTLVTIFYPHQNGRKPA